MCHDYVGSNVYQLPVPVDTYVRAYMHAIQSAQSEQNNFWGPQMFTHPLSIHSNFVQSKTNFAHAKVRWAGV